MGSLVSDTGIFPFTSVHVVSDSMGLGEISIPYSPSRDQRTLRHCKVFLKADTAKTATSRTTTATGKQ